MAVLNVNWFFGTEDIEVREDGVIDEDVVEAYSCGHCHAFALALHRATGWELVGTGWEAWDREDFTCEDGCDHKGHGDISRVDAYPYRGEGGSWLIPNHVLVRDEDGGLWDITGRTNGSDVRPMAVEVVEAGLYGLYRDADEAFAASFLDAWMGRHQ